MKGVLNKLIANTTHSQSFFVSISTRLVAMNVIPIEALSDNYMYLLVDEKTKQCAAVDPVEPDKVPFYVSTLPNGSLNILNIETLQVLDKVREMGLKLISVLTTHHHWDHADGNPGLLKKLGETIPVYGGDDRIPALNHKVSHDDVLSVGALHVRCLFTPCHTTGHICYFVTEATTPPVVFTGDTLFLSGCGRFFEGNATQMHCNLIDILGNLPNETVQYDFQI